MHRFVSSEVIRTTARRNAIAGVMFVLSAVVVAGCGKQPAVETTPAPTKEPTAFRLAYGKKIHYAAQIVALKEGLFAKEGLAVEAKAVQAGIQAAEAMTCGSADIAVMGDAPAIIAAASGMPVKIVASYVRGGDRMHRIVAGPKSGIKAPADLKGKRVGIQMGSSTHGAFLLFLSKHELDPKEVKLVPLDPSDMPEAMLAGQIDAGVGSEPWPSNIEERVKGSYEVAPLSGLGNNYPLVMLATASYAQEHPEAVVAALRATQQAVALMHQDPDRAAGIIAEATGVPVARERKFMEMMEWGVVMDDVTINSLKQTAAFLHSQGKITSLPDWEKVIDRSFVQRMSEAG